MKTYPSCCAVWLWRFCLYGKTSGFIYYLIYLSTAFMAVSSKNTSGRKHASQKSFVRHRGELVRINNKEGQGVHMATLKKSFEQFDIALDRWKRLMFMRFDLWPGSSNETNEIMKLHRERYSYQFRKHGIEQFGFHWTREQGRGDTEHYHLAIWVDGDRYRTSFVLGPIIREAWEHLGGTVSKYDGQKHYQFVDDEQSRLEVLGWLSYFSKVRSKGKKPVQTKEHGMSRLKPLNKPKI